MFEMSINIKNESEAGSLVSGARVMVVLASHRKWLSPTTLQDNLNKPKQKADYYYTHVKETILSKTWKDHQQ